MQKLERRNPLKFAEVYSQQQHFCRARLMLPKYIELLAKECRPMIAMIANRDRSSIRTRHRSLTFGPQNGAHGHGSGHVCPVARVFLLAAEISPVAVPTWKRAVVSVAVAIR